MPVDKIVYVDKPYEVLTIKEVPIERIVKQEVLVEVPGPERIIKHIQAHCDHEHCDSFLTLDGKCPVCPLKSRLSQPQAPSITARDTFCKPCADGFEWADNISKTTVVQVVHPQRDGWQKHLPVILYVTLNGSQPRSCPLPRTQHTTAPCTPRLSGHCARGVMLLVER